MPAVDDDQLFVIPVSTRSSTTVVIALSDSNIERIRQHDPVALSITQLWALLGTRPPVSDVMVTYASLEDRQFAMQAVQEGRAGEAFERLTRGFAFRPERGDHDRGPVKLT